MGKHDRRPDRKRRVNYPALLAPSRLAAIGHSLRAGLSRNDSVPRDPVRGRGPASSSRPRFGRGLSGPPSTVCVDCPADLIPGVLALSPEMGTELNRSRSSFPSTGRDTIAPQEPVYSWLLLSRMCTGRAVYQGTSRRYLPVCERASSPACSRCSLRPGAPRYRLLKSGRTPRRRPWKPPRNRSGPSAREDPQTSRVSPSRKSRPK